MEWLVLGLYSLAGAAIWFGFYCLSARARVRRAEGKGKKPKLLLVRIVYIATGILGQLFFWFTVIAMKNGFYMR